ncbi:caspase family protein [Kribbella sp. NPDC050820]|uniref:caspase family protein n=1 Tax=Kribbella sp. NPDC050820 TaxID=3155408 RepID=UPI003400B846
MAGRRKALIVANDVYEHEGLGRLRAPAADAQALGGVLGDPGIGGFDVEVVRNESAHVIQGRVEDLFADSRPEDVLLLHFSCHGLKSESGELFFAARNTLPNRLGSTAVSADFVQRCLRMSRSRSIVLLLDCCYGGAFGRGVTVRAAGDANVLDSFSGGKLGGGRGRAVITASSATEYAFEGDRLADDRSSPSVFTAALVEGLASGDADLDQDGWVSLNELYDYVFDRVRERNPHQTPSRDVEMQGELYIARRSRPVTVPAPLPAELRELIDHPLATVRVGAVQELAGLLQGRNAGLALAARVALERLADDDSRSVAAAATAALSAAAPGPRPQPEPRPEPRPEPARQDRYVRSWRRRLVYLSGAGVVLAAGTVVALQLVNDNDPPGGGGAAADEFNEASPWRLRVRGAGGCIVTVRNVDSGQQKVFDNLWGPVSFQIADTGRFEANASDPVCIVTHSAGTGQIALPFAQKNATGDSDAFTVPSGDKAIVRVVAFNSYGRCDFELHDATDGRPLDFGGTQPGGPPVQLDPRGSSKVYLAHFYGCDVQVSSG